MENFVSVSVEELIIGRALEFPIQNDEGVLLLAAGSTITSEQKQKLRDRGFRTVELSESDVGRVTARRAGAGRAAELPTIGPQDQQRLGTPEFSGRFALRNAGPPMRTGIVSPGAEPYDSARGAQLASQFDAHRATINELIARAAEGGQMNPVAVAAVADSCIGNLITDLDHTLCVSLLHCENPDLAAHSLNVSLLGMAVGIEMGLDEANVRLLGLCGLLQDLGMAQVPASIRCSDRALTTAEFLELQKHPTRTVNLLKRIPQLPSLVPLVAFQIHERPDGSGYPCGRGGRNIHLFARILHVADAFIAMTARRPYRLPLMPYAAMECLLRQAQQRRVDADVVRALLRVLSLFPIGSLVTLSDSSVAQVLRSNRDDYTRPVVLRILDADGQDDNGPDEERILDLLDSRESIVQALPTPGRIEAAFAGEFLDRNLGRTYCRSRSAMQLA